MSLYRGVVYFSGRYYVDEPFEAATEDEAIDYVADVWLDTQDVGSSIDDVEVWEVKEGESVSD